jgi:hypothetical protein
MWLQRLVNAYPQLLNNAVREGTGLREDVEFEWLSPLEVDQYAEYCDQSFLDLLGAHLDHRPLNAFWPTGGPNWDALGRSEQGHLILIEAKSHIPEMVSPPTRAAGRSRDRIISSLQETQRFLRADMTTDWSRHFYQFANRIAHLHLLRTLNKVPAFLVTIYFVGDAEMGGPMTVEEWRGAIRLVKTFLRVRSSRLAPYMLDVFMEVDPLRPPAQP